MDVVIRTPHGDADVEIISVPGDATLGDLVRAITGQTPPPVARVDGRTISAERPIDDIDLAIGTVIDTHVVEPSMHPTDADTGAERMTNPSTTRLVQLTGRGAGSVIDLQPGRFRIGPGRRLVADEMTASPVETSAFEISIHPTGAAVVTPGPRVSGPVGVLTPSLDGQLFDRELPWRSGRLSVGGRIFEIDRGPLTERRPLPPPDERGVIPFQRTPGATPTDDRPAVGARRRATTAGPDLWQCRSNDPGAHSVAFGVLPDGRTSARVDFAQHRGLAIVGSERFASGIARTLIVEAATLHGPADLAIVIVSTPDRSGRWDWAKWLPHTRQGRPGRRPDIVARSADLDTWVTTFSATTLSATTLPVTTHSTAATTSPSTLPPPAPDGTDGAPGASTATATIPAPTWAAPTPTGVSSATATYLILDDSDLWTRRDSPVRRLLTNPPADLRVIALCSASNQVPGVCTAVVEETTPQTLLATTDGVDATVFGSLADLHIRSGVSPAVIRDIRPALVESSVAAEIARALAPLDDFDLDPQRAPGVPDLVVPPTLAELLTGPDASIDPALESSLSVAVGIAEQSADGTRRPVRVDLAAASVTLISMPDSDDRATLTAAILLGAAQTLTTDDLSILSVTRRRPAWHDRVEHLGGHIDRNDLDRGVLDADRVLQRVTGVLEHRRELRVVVVVDDAFRAPSDPAASDARPIELVDRLLALCNTEPGLCLVLTTDLDPTELPAEIRSNVGAEVTMLRDENTPRGRLTVDQTTVAFVGPSIAGRTGTTSVRGRDELVVRPSVVGRPMSELERRLARSSVSVDAAERHDTAIELQVQRLGFAPPKAAGPDTTEAKTLLPPPLPTAVDALALLSAHPGDGVPIGLVDVPERAESDVYWWQPGSGGSLIVVGSPRSGMTAIVDLIVTGIAARVSADDLHVYAIEPLPQRRRALQALPHAGSVATTDEPVAVERVVNTLFEMFTERRDGPPDADRPDLLLMIGDLARLRRWLPDTSEARVLDQLAEIATSGSALGIDLVVLGSRVDDFGPLLRLSGDRLIGSVGDDDRVRLGVPANAGIERHVGRCWSTSAHRTVQLATPPTSVEQTIADISPEPARTRLPRPVGTTEGAVRGPR